MLDFELRESFIKALLVTKSWRDCLEFFEPSPFVESPSPLTHRDVISKAFDENEAEIGWSVMQKMINVDQTPPPKVYQAYLRYCHRHKDDLKGNLERMFHFLQDNQLYITQNVANELAKLLTDFKRSHKFAEITDEFVSF